MFYLMTASISLLTSTLFYFMTHPLSMGMVLLVHTIVICSLTGLITKTFWFSYILFLIFLGGMLVLFIYVTSLASNEMFNFSTNLLLMNLLIFFFMLMSLLIIDNTIILTLVNNLESQTMSFMNVFLNENSSMLNKIYNFPTNLITILLMIYLFLTLIAVVKITNVFEGPLRPSFN